MPHHELLALLTRSRAVHQRYLFEADGETLRDDVAEVCMAIDDVLSGDAPTSAVELSGAALERSAA